MITTSFTNKSSYSLEFINVLKSGPLSSRELRPRPCVPIPRWHPTEVGVCIFGKQLWLLVGDSDHKLGQAELRRIAQFTFAHHALVWLVGAFHTVLALAVTLWQLLSDDVCAS